MTRWLIVPAAAALCGLAACAPALTQQNGPSDLERIQTRLASSEEKLEQLSQQVALLQTMVDRQQRSLQAAQQATGTDQPDVQSSMPGAIPDAPQRGSIEDAPGTTDVEPAVSPDQLSASVQDASHSGPISPPPSRETAEEATTDIDAQPTVSPNRLSVSAAETSQAGTIPQPIVAQPSTATESREDLTPAPPVTPVTPLPAENAEFDIPAPEAYQDAMDILRAGDYETASDQFKAFAAQFPGDDLADNALYWAGECNYTQRKFTEAIRLFKQVVDKYPSGSKVPDALLKTGYTYISLGDNDTAATYLKQVIAKYPFSSAATKAEERLETLR